MSAADAERFVDDVAKDKQLAERVKPHAAGLAALVAGAKTLGYTFTVDELKQAMRGKAKQNLNDAQLDAIAGGAGGGSQPPTVSQSNVAAVVTVLDYTQIQVVSASQVNSVVVITVT
jgi:predicted ribosomally synthesized peptide with nif11-like leader